ncbi:hypothetical protein ACXM5X_21195 [Pseudomonas saponiphila]
MTPDKNKIISLDLYSPPQTIPVNALNDNAAGAVKRRRRCLWELAW